MRLLKSAVVKVEKGKRYFYMYMEKIKLIRYQGNVKLCTVKHIYSDHAHNEMTLITKRLGIPGKHYYIFVYKFYTYSEVAYNEITLITK